MSSLRAALFIASRDLGFMLWSRETLLWTFVMPILFFYFTGTVTGGMGSPTGSEDRPDLLAMRAPRTPGSCLTSWSSGSRNRTSASIARTPTRTGHATPASSP